jgi:hypothetical protein
MLLVGALAASLAGLPAQASAASLNTSECVEGAFSQPFLSEHDSNWYTLMTGQSSSGFTGAGWQLSGGASIEQTTLPNGTSGTVLNLPSGSKAVSPVACVTSDYPTARAYVRNVVGAEGVSFYVSYEGTKTWERPKNTGQIHGANGAWAATTAVNIQPEHVSGWQPLRITLEPGGHSSDFQVYDLYLDPRLAH